MTYGARFDRWFHTPIEQVSLQRLRLLVGVFVVVYLVIRMPLFLELADRSTDRWDPVGLLLLWDTPWPGAVIRAMTIAAVPLAVLYAAGVAFRATGPALAIVLLLLFSYRSSWGQLLHFEHLIFIHVAVLAFTAAGRGTDGEAVSGWPVRLLAIVTATTYVLAAWAKVRFGGPSWVFGDTLRNHVASASVRRELLGASSPPIGRWLVGQAWAFPVLGLATLAIEFGAPLALVGNRWRNVWVAAAWAMHAGIAVTMYIVFPMPLFLVAFAPLYAFDNGAQRRHLLFRP